MNMNKYTVQDTLLSSNVDDFAEKFAEMSIMSLIDFFSDYNQIKLDSKSQDMTAFQNLTQTFSTNYIVNESNQLPRAIFMHCHESS